MRMREDEGMNEAQRLAGELREVHEGNPWHGPSTKEILSGISHATAAAKPKWGSHSIWEMVIHLTTWMDITRRRLEGAVVEATPEEDWKSVGDASDESWSNTLTELDHAERKLEEMISRFSDADLQKPAPGKDHSVLFMLEGVVYHSVYHGAQISIIRKSIENW